MEDKARQTLVPRCSILPGFDSPLQPNTLTISFKQYFNVSAESNIRSGMFACSHFSEWKLVNTFLLVWTVERERERERDREREYCTIGCLLSEVGERSGQAWCRRVT